MFSFYLVSIFFIGFSVCRPQFGGPPPPGGFGPVPPPIAAVLPKDILAQLESIHADQTLSELDKHRKIDSIMVNLPDEVHDRIPPPPGFQQLPQEVQQQLKKLHRDKSLDFIQRQAAIKQIIESLAPEHRRLLPPPPPGFPQH